MSHIADACQMLLKNCDILLPCFAKKTCLTVFLCSVQLSSVSLGMWEIDDSLATARFFWIQKQITNAIDDK